MARKITISFKNTTKDIELFELIMEMEDKSAEIKSILREKLINNSERIDKKKSDNSNINIMNF